MKNIQYSQQLHWKRIISSQVFCIRFSLELKLPQYFCLIDPYWSGFGLCGLLYLPDACLFYFTYSELHQVSKLKWIFLLIELINR